MSPAALLLLPLPSTATLLPLSDPHNTRGWTPYAPMTDEFGGDALDATKWSTDSSSWAGRQPGLFSAANVAVLNGSLRLSARTARRNPSWPAGYDNFTTAALHSTAHTAHGYFEVRSRSGSSSISSSWWFHFNDGNGTWTTWTEIDVYESQGSDAPQASWHNASLLCSHTHVFKLAGVESADLPAKCGCKFGHRRARSGVDGATDQPVCSRGGCTNLPFRLDGGWHTYGLEWNSSAVGIYADGAPVGEALPAGCLAQPIGMDFDRETMPDWMGLPDPATLPDWPFEVDYVRAWKAAGLVEEAGAS